MMEPQAYDSALPREDRRPKIKARVSASSLHDELNMEMPGALQLQIDLEDVPQADECQKALYRLRDKLKYAEIQIVEVKDSRCGERVRLEVTLMNDNEDY